MSIESDLGTLIRMCNPYGGGRPGTMHMGPGAPLDVRQIAEASPPAIEDLGRFHVQVENYAGEWLFKGISYRVNRALLIPYRCPLTAKDGTLLPVFATQHLLIGYAGGNGP
jgi:hypothetical protein